MLGPRPRRERRGERARTVPVVPVEFDPASGSLRFSPSEDAAGEDWRQSLLNQAKPLQIELLRRYGNSLAKCSDCVPSDAEDIQAPREEMDEADSSAGSSAASESPQPLCVCGAQMERVSARQRIERVLLELAPSFRSAAPAEQSRRIDQLMDRPLVHCDLCAQVATRSGACWMCKSGHHTILHPSAYDVCEACFEQYTGSRSLPSASSMRPIGAPRAGGGCVNVVCDLFPVGVARLTSAGRVERRSVGVAEVRHLARRGRRGRRALYKTQGPVHLLGDPACISLGNLRPGRREALSDRAPWAVDSHHLAPSYTDR
eukprot:CAMPEP_0170350696 /NCGR_PEP_ID=MMETSP0116_2-20130129/76646_1 /TAXON_ID=400756 /ORGANISM="Durinskia baltica, Strain CSIRO CS-38" /LENGTH=315 /DNA_ID=CAMNT_0010604595 /DNA_START=46 /DNA_END=991 /DNA_ORIENTATION=-